VVLQAELKECQRRLAEERQARASMEEQAIALKRAGTQFTSTKGARIRVDKSSVLEQHAIALKRGGAQFTCVTSTKVLASPAQKLLVQKYTTALA